MGGEIKQEHEDDCIKPCKSELSDLGNPASKSTSENTGETCLQFSSLENDCILDKAPIPDCNKARGLKPLVGCENKKGDSGFLVESGGTTEETGVDNVDAGFEQGKATNGLEDGGLIADTSSLKDPRQLHVQFPAGDVKLPPGTDHVPNGSFEGYGNHSKLVCRDDDENYCKYYKLSDKCQSYRPLTGVGNRRIKKSVMTKSGRAIPRSKWFEDTRTG